MALTQVKTSGIADDAIDITKLKAGTDGELILMMLLVTQQKLMLEHQDTF